MQTTMWATGTSSLRRILGDNVEPASESPYPGASSLVIYPTVHWLRFSGKDPRCPVFPAPTPLLKMDAVARESPVTKSCSYWLLRRSDQPPYPCGQHLLKQLSIRGHLAFWSLEKYHIAILPFPCKMNESSLNILETA